MAKPHRDVFYGRYLKTGGSFSVLIPPDVREIMGFRLGDGALMFVDNGVLCMTKATRDMVIDRKRASAIFERMFQDRTADNG